MEGIDAGSLSIPGFAGTLDKDGIGVAGHSWGSYTALSIGGATSTAGSFGDPRAKAIVATSPGEPRTAIRSFRRVSTKRWMLSGVCIGDGTHCSMESPLMAALSEDDRRELIRVGRRRQFARREVIFHEGDPGDTFHVLLKGHVAVRVTTPLGDVAILQVLTPGQVFGELALIDPAPRNATVAALDPCETLALSSRDLAGLRRTCPQIDRVFLEAMIAEVRRLSALLLEVMYVPVDKRLYRRLADLVDVYGGGTGDDPVDAGRACSTCRYHPAECQQVAGYGRGGRSAHRQQGTH